MADTLSPMMQQYQSIRRRFPRIRCCCSGWGIFTRCFSRTPRRPSGILNVALTKRNGVPMCGVPYHAAEGYMAKLIKAGKRAAICDQIGEAAAGAALSSAK